MTRRWDPSVEELLDAAQNQDYTGEEDWPEWLGELDLENLLELHHLTKGAMRQMRAVVTEVKQRLTDTMGENGKVHDGHTFYRYTAPRKRRAAFTPEKVFEWLGADAAECFHIDDIKILAFRAIARRRGEEEGSEDPDAYAKMVEDSLLETRPSGKPQLEQLPMDRAPQYAAKMKPGRLIRDRKELK